MAVELSVIVDDWQTWHEARERDLNTAYGWLTVVAFDWLGPVAAQLPGLPGTWWVSDGRAQVTASGELSLHGEPLDGTTSASVAEAGSLSWLLYGETLVELVLRGGRYAVRQRDPRAATRVGFSGVPTYPVDPAWVVTGHFTPRRNGWRWRLLGPICDSTCRWWVRCTSRSAGRRTSWWRRLRGTGGWPCRSTMRPTVVRPLRGAQ